MDDGLPIPKTGRREYAELVERGKLNDKQKAALCEKQAGVCAGCRKKPIHGWEFDHIDELWEAGTNEPKNWQAFGSRKDCDCHSIKTGDAAKRRARMNRIRGKTGQIKRRKERGSLLKGNPQIRSRGFEQGSRKIAQRGFSKTKSRGFDGRVKERT